ncbi:PREDICTED: probable serine/threonine-protein kinase DDB_G0278845 isoform X2 [Polistes canadensis]|uniref:probable serine/threonine-protein kinase DDB_G0278845 isoform X2 n=1 Tax=Polistes canadensis TaxID=91411 RepID=UPI000718D1F6|nr:PREDICTED: probable serine/threonine-protein kinase DDB_G0278845 isoform X2 [Polistes canadensis]
MLSPVSGTDVTRKQYDAVDEESPSSSSKKLTISPSEVEKNVTLEIPLESSNKNNPVHSLMGKKTDQEEILPSVFEIKGRDELSRCQVIETTEILDPYGSEKIRKDIFVDKRGRTKENILEKLSVPIEKISYDLDKGSTLQTETFTTELQDPKWKNTSSLSSDNVKIASSPEETSDSEIIEVRKDSALFLEEAEGFDPREFAKRLSGTYRFSRPRRESSGYASNLGTFDEDRRNSGNFDVIQDFSKERRRSSAKRLNSRYGEEELRFSLASGINNNNNNNNRNNNNGLERMPTTEVHRKLSSSGLDMPDIEEVKELVKDDSNSSSLSQENLHDLGHANEKSSNQSSIVSTNVTDSECVTKSLENLSNECWPKETTTVRTNIVSDTCSKEKEDEAIVELLGKKDDEVESIVETNLSSNNENSITTSIECVREEIQLESSEESSKQEDDLEIIDSMKKKKKKLKKKSMIIDNTKPEIISRSTNKVYRFISTQSEDRTDDRLDIELCPNDRRISLEITRRRGLEEEGELMGKISDRLSSIVQLSTNFSSNVSPTNNHSKKDETRNDDANFVDGGSGGGGGAGDGGDGAGCLPPSNNVPGVRVLTGSSTTFTKFSQDGEIVSGTSITHHRVLADVAAVSVRPIYPYCPYSPYGSPQGSPRNRRRPLRESRRVSIDNTQGGLQLNQYRLMDNIGQGSYGIVKLAYNEEDETHYAMKILSKRKLMKKAGIFGRMAPGRKGSADPLAKVYREIALLKKLDHPNVVKLVEVLDDPDEDNLYLVFELVQKGEVLQIPTDKPLDEDTARKNFRDVVMGIEYLHYQRIVHRDIKPSNLLVDSDGRIKIADLGVSAELRASGELLSGPAGTPAFAAPETTILNAHYSGTPCDVWSMGVTLYSLVTGKVPWDGAGSIIGVQDAIRTEPLKFPERPKLSQDLRDLIERMLAKRPNDRISLQCLKEHVWLTNTGKDPLPSEADNCRLQVTVTDEEVERVVTKIPKLDTLILVKKMLKQHSFQNPFLPKRTSGRISGGNEGGDHATEESSLPLEGTAESLIQRATTSRNIKSERFQRSGRSNSAPDSYDWQANNRQISMESPLPPVTEASNQEAEIEKR